MKNNNRLIKIFYNQQIIKNYQNLMFKINYNKITKRQLIKN